MAGMCSTHIIITCTAEPVYMTVYGNNCHTAYSMKFCRFMMKFELAVILNSSTIELTYLPSLKPIACFALELEYFVHNCATLTKKKKRKYGLKVLLCTHIAFPYTTHEPEIN